MAYLRKGDTFAELAAGFGIGTATAWRYVTETVTLVPAHAPKLRQAQAAAGRAGHAVAGSRWRFPYGSGEPARGASARIATIGLIGVVGATASERTGGMAGKIENWRLILDAAQALTAEGKAPFSRVSVYEWIWQRYPRNDHDRPSLDPTFQGMVCNATGGPKSRAGTPLLRIGQGQYVLDGSSGKTGAMPAAPITRSGSSSRSVTAPAASESGRGTSDFAEAIVIEVTIGRVGGAGPFRVDVLHSPAGEASAVVALDAEGLRGRQTEMQRAVLSSAVPVRRVLAETEECLRDVGRVLFSALLGTGDVAGRYQASAAIAADRGRQLRVITRMDDPVLAGLPWEAMYDDAAGEYLCRRGQLVRHVPFGAPIPPLAVQLPLRILAVASSPRDLPRLDVSREQEQLGRALADLARAGLAEVSWAPSATWADLQDTLLDGHWHVVHFIGHGDYNPSRDEGVLALVGEDGRADLVGASRLVDLLRQARPVPRLVVLNSCSGAATGSADVFSGTAAALVRGGVSAVAAMQYSISDRAAVAFCRGFYSALARGRGVDEAVSSGRVAILGLSEQTLEWVTPVLYLRGRDSRLFTMPAPPSPATAARETPSEASLNSAKWSSATSWGDTLPPVPKIDTSAPNSARIWNYWLGGKDHFLVDCRAGEIYREIYPGITNIAQAVRQFMARAVRYLVVEAGVRQFLDIGAGLPAVDNTHEVAQQIAPECRIVYVDNDPLVLMHVRALLTSAPEGACGYVEADMRDTATLLDQASQTLDLSRPVALLFMEVLGHINDESQAATVVREFMDGLVSGSYLALADSINIGEGHIAAAENYARTDAVPYKLRSPAQIVRFFEGMRFIRPGLVSVEKWRPDPAESAPIPVDALGGVAKKLISERERRKLP